MRGGPMSGYSVLSGAVAMAFIWIAQRFNLPTWMYPFFFLAVTLIAFVCIAKFSPGGFSFLSGPLGPCVSPFWLPDEEIEFISGPGTFDLEVEGEGVHLPDLEARLFSDGAMRYRSRARLVLEDENPDDPRSVRVDVEEFCIGYLSPIHARRFRQALRPPRAREYECAVLVVSERESGLEGAQAFLDIPHSQSVS